MLSFTWNASNLFFGDVIFLYVSYKTTHAASHNFSFHFFMRKFNDCRKMCWKACVTTRNFSIESTAFILISGNVSAIETICNFYTGITWTIKSNQVRKDI